MCFSPFQRLSVCVFSRAVLCPLTNHIILWPICGTTLLLPSLGASGGLVVLLLAAVVIICLVVLVLRLRRRGRSASYHVKKCEDELTKGPPNATNPIISAGEQIDLCGTLAEDC